MEEEQERKREGPGDQEAKELVALMAEVISKSEAGGREVPRPVTGLESLR